MEFSKIVVLGSNSFSGSNFVDYALEKTNSDVIGISRSKEPKDIFLPYKNRKESFARFKFQQADLNQNLEEIIKILDKEKPEVIVNFVAQGEVRNSWNLPEQWYQTNVLSLVKLVNQLKDRDYLYKFVQISTPEVYGNTDKDVKESKRYNPGTPYAATKTAGDQFLELMFKRNNFPVTFTRAANVYGVGQQLFRIIPKTIIQFKKKNSLELHGGGKSERAFIHIKDVADATLKVAQQGENGEIYHISPDNETISIRDLASKICEVTNTNFEDYVIMGEENFGQDSLYSLDSKKIRDELKWESKTSLDEGIRQVRRWIDDNWDVIKDLPVEYVHKV
jgi:dTDP-glucose 4,6-dehydratase